MSTEEGTVLNKAQQAAQDLKTRFSDASNTAKSRTSEFATHTAARAREVTSEFGHQMKEFGEKLRQKSPHETVRNTTHKVADSIESAGVYLEEKNLDGMLDDVAGVIRRYPLQSLLAGIAIGFLLSRKRRDEL
jgi:DNA polymerase I-like protein with 3'-5' exonuclease and polymerase domains